MVRYVLFFSVFLISDCSMSNDFGKEEQALNNLVAIVDADIFFSCDKVDYRHVELINKTTKQVEVLVESQYETGNINDFAIFLVSLDGIKRNYEQYISACDGNHNLDLSYEKEQYVTRVNHIKSYLLKYFNEFLYKEKIQMKEVKRENEYSANKRILMPVSDANHIMALIRDILELSENKLDSVAINQQLENLYQLKQISDENVINFVEGAFQLSMASQSLISFYEQLKVSEVTLEQFEFLSERELKVLEKFVKKREE